MVHSQALGTNTVVSSMETMALAALKDSAWTYHFLIAYSLWGITLALQLHVPLHPANKQMTRSARAAFLARVAKCRP